MEINTDYENVINLYLQGERFFKEKPNSVDTSIELKVTLIKRIPISPTVYIFIFQYPPELEQHFMLHIFAHFEFKGERMLPKVQGQWNGKICQQNDTNQVSRKYTPIYIDQDKKEVHILMRIYRPCEEYPDGGSLTRVIECLIPQDPLTIYPSMFKFSLTQNGALTIGGDKVVEFNHLNLVAGGTGITPYVRYLINNKKTPVNLVYCNKTLKEILLKPLLDKLQERGLLKVKYLVTSEDPEVIRNYKANNEAVVFGKLSIEHCEGFLETKDSFTIACGPPGMVMKAKEITTQLGSHVDEKKIMKRFIAKATILARMAAMRLNRPLATKTRTDEKSLEASIRAVDLLKRFVDILEIAQVIHHKTLIPSIGKLVGATEDEIAKSGNIAKQNQGILKPIERIHNLHEEEWRILKPGKERETRHLRWRK